MLRHITISHTSQEPPPSPPVTKALRLHRPGCSPHPSSCTPPTNLGLVGARTARHDREPGGLQVRVRVSLAEEKGHQEAALLAELYCKEQLPQQALLPEADHTRYPSSSARGRYPHPFHQRHVGQPRRRKGTRRRHCLRSFIAKSSFVPPPRSAERALPRREGSKRDEA